MRHIMIKPGFLIGILATLLSTTHGGDPCPFGASLAPCTCNHVPIALPSPAKEDAAQDAPEKEQIVTPSSASQVNVKSNNNSAANPNDAPAGDPAAQPAGDSSSPNPVSEAPPASAPAPAPAARKAAPAARKAPAPAAGGGAAAASAAAGPGGAAVGTAAADGAPNNTYTEERRRKRALTEAQERAYEVIPVRNATYFTVVNCTAPKSLFALEDAIVDALYRKWVDKLIVAGVPPMKGLKVVRLPSEWLKNVRIKQFKITETLLSGDFISKGNPFQGQDQSLIWFSVNNCWLSGALTFDTPGTVNTKGLEALPRIEGVDFGNNNLAIVMASSFQFPSKNLTTVILKRNSIQSVELTTFQNTPNLKYIDLSRNLLETIARDIFASPASVLQHIDLSWNRLSVLPTDFFSDMPGLKTVNLKSNFLFTMPEKPWGVVWRKLTAIDVSGNFVECNCDLLWLVSILSPDVVNGTSPQPEPLPDQIIRGQCARTEPGFLISYLELNTLTRDSLQC